MKIIWPPEETLTYEAKYPTLENGIVINALPGGKASNKKNNKAKGETR